MAKMLGSEVRWCSSTLHAGRAVEQRAARQLGVGGGAGGEDHEVAGDLVASPDQAHAGGAHRAEQGLDVGAEADADTALAHHASAR